MVVVPSFEYSQFYITDVTESKKFISVEVNLTLDLDRNDFFLNIPFNL